MNTTAGTVAAVSGPPGPPVVGVPTAPPLSPDLEALLRRLRLPHVRRHAPDVLAAAKAQRWDPAEVLRVLLAEEVSGRDRSALATRRAAAAFPTGKTFAAWQPEASSIPPPHSRRCGPWSGSGGGRTSLSAARPEPGRRSCSKPSASKRSNAACTSPGSPWRTSGSSCGGTAPMTPSPKPSRGSCARTSWSSTTSACFPSPPTPPKASTGSSTPLRETQRRRLEQPAPRRLRRAHAQDPRHRRPAAPPRPRLPDQRRQRPPVPGPRRTGGDPLDLTATTQVASSGQIPWPPPGTSRDRHWAGLVTASGQFLVPLDTPAGWSSRSPSRRVTGKSAKASVPSAASRSGASTAGNCRRRAGRRSCGSRRRPSPRCLSAPRGEHVADEGHPAPHGPQHRPGRRQRRGGPYLRGHPRRRPHHSMGTTSRSSRIRWTRLHRQALLRDRSSMYGSSPGGP